MDARLSEWMGALGPGSHVGHVYADPAEQAEVGAAFLIAGLAAGQQCVCVAKASVLSRLSEALEQAGEDLAGQTQRGALRLLTAEEAFAGTMGDPAAMVAQAEQLVGEATRSGYPAIRLLGDLSGLRAQDPPAAAVLEAGIETSAAMARAVVLCQVDRQCVPEEAARQAVAQHRQLVVGGGAGIEIFHYGPQAGDEAQSRAKDEFLANLSHELRTPLMPVLATVSALQERPNIPADLRTDLDMIRRNIEIEARLIDDLLDMTRIAHNKLELNTDTIDAHDTLASALEIARQGEGQHRDLRITAELSAAAHHCQADAGRLRQVFWNLIRNAIKFTPDGGSIHVRTRNEPGRNDRLVLLVAEIADSGMGIEPDAMARLFRPFEQGPAGTTRRFGGLGLGLVICKALVEAHGGALTAASAGAGRGATFTVALPTVAAPVLELRLAPRAIAAAQARRGLRVLLVEDHEDTARTMARLLESFGHTVRTAGSISAARTVAEQAAGALDLVIGDLGLPDGSGLDLMRELRQRYGLRGIALSGYGMEADRQRSAEAGFLEHLVKPVNLARLEEAIQRVAALPPDQA